MVSSPLMSYIASLSSPRQPSVVASTSTHADNLNIRMIKPQSPSTVELGHFSTKKELLSVFIDVLEVHQELLRNDIPYRNICLESIRIYRPTVESPNIINSTSSDPQISDRTIAADCRSTSLRKGLLVDQDTNLAAHGPSRRVRRTNYKRIKLQYLDNLQFKAIEFLEGEPHAPRHDPESFKFYLLIWICWHYAGPNNSPRQRFEITNAFANQWIAVSSDESWRDIALTKASVFHMEMYFERTVLEHIAPYFDALKPCLGELRSIIFETDLKQHHFIEVLQKAMESLPAEESWSAEDDPKGYGLEWRRATSRRSNLDSEDDSEEYEIKEYNVRWRPW